MSFLLDPYLVDPLTNERPEFLGQETTHFFDKPVEISPTSVVNGPTLSVSGDAFISQSLIINDCITCKCVNTISDRRLKQNLKPLTDVNLDDVLVYSYNFIGDKKICYGVVAQEIAYHKYFRDAAKYDPNKRLYSVDYIQFIPVLIKEVQQIKKIIRTTITGFLIVGITIIATCLKTKIFL